MQVQSISNNYKNNQICRTNFKGKFIMNNDLYLHNIVAPTENLNIFKNTLKKIGEVNDNLVFFIKEQKNWYTTCINGIYGRDYKTSYKLYKQTGNDESTKEQLGSAIYFDREVPKESEYKIISPSDLLKEVSARLENYYENITRDSIKKEIDELTIREDF